MHLIATIAKLLLPGGARSIASESSEPDRRLRQQLLERVWADDGTYTDPTAHVAGIEGLVDHIGRIFVQFPGARVELTSGIDMHHEMLCFTWRMLHADERVLLDGIDFGQLSSDGRLLRIVGFFEPPTPKS